MGKNDTGQKGNEMQKKGENRSQMAVIVERRYLKSERQ